LLSLFRIEKLTLAVSTVVRATWLPLKPAFYLVVASEASGITEPRLHALQLSPPSKTLRFDFMTL
jgi:hypothetical protein